MVERPDAYGEAFADVYDEWYGLLPDLAGAVTALLELAGGAGGTVLELGVGTGRLAVRLAEAGAEVWGVDASPAMLERLAARPGGEAVHARLGDMADPRAALAGAPPFAVVVAAFNTFFLLPSAEAQERCLAAARDALAPGGHVVVEAFVPAAAEENEYVVAPSAVGRDRPVLTVSEHRPDEQLVIGQHLDRDDDGVLHQRPWMVRYSTPPQLDEIAARAGLQLADRWGGWNRQPFDDESTVHVSLYQAR